MIIAQLAPALVICLTLVGQFLLKCQVFPHLKNWLAQVAASRSGWGGIDFPYRVFSSCCIWLLRSLFFLSALVSFLLSVASTYLSAMVLTASCTNLSNLLCQECRSITFCWQPFLPSSACHQSIHFGLPLGPLPHNTDGWWPEHRYMEAGEDASGWISIRSVHCLWNSPLFLVADWILIWYVRSSAEEASVCQKSRGFD